MTATPGDQQLRQTVSELLVRIQENQQIQSRFHDFEFQLLECRRLGELLHKLLVDGPRHFDVAAVSLWLWDGDGQIERLLTPLVLGDFEGRLQLKSTTEDFLRLFPGTPRVRLGAPDRDSRRLFASSTPFGSVALMPLLRQQRQLGSLHFASQSPQRYSAEKGVSFLTHLAAMTAVCLENCIALEQLQWQGQRDPLTQALNRRGFDEEFTKELERAHRQDQSLSCAFVDVDHFKRLNDRWGHQLGDQCLREVADAVAGQLRKTDLLARYGGEEFVVLLPNCPATEAAAIAERIRQAVAHRPMVAGAADTLTVSVGLATWQPSHQQRINVAAVGDGLLAAADRAMYQAKQTGRNRVRQVDFVVDAQGVSV